MEIKATTAKVLRFVWIHEVVFYVHAPGFTYVGVEKKKVVCDFPWPSLLKKGRPNNHGRRAVTLVARHEPEIFSRLLSLSFSLSLSSLGLYE